MIDASPDAVVHLGFNRPVVTAELDRWVRDQDIETLLAATNGVPVSAGDTVLCPAGTPHAISDGVLLVELQEPTDLSIMLEWSTFSLAEDEATLGLPLAEALSCIDRRACPPERLTERRGRSLNSGGRSPLPADADPFFLAERFDAQVSHQLSQSYSVLVFTQGPGHLATEDGSSLPVGRGSVSPPVVGWPGALSGDLEGVRGLPAVARLGLWPRGGLPGRQPLASG